MGMMKFIYEVPALAPKGKDEECRPGGYGFTTTLDGDFAVAARKTPMEDKRLEIFQKDGSEIIKRSKLKGIGYSGNPYVFIENSMLLHYVQVPGNACDLGLHWFEEFVEDRWPNHSKLIDELKRRGDSPAPVRYIPHNVDSFQQASALLALWLNWANSSTWILNK